MTTSNLLTCEDREVRQAKQQLTLALPMTRRALITLLITFLATVAYITHARDSSRIVDVEDVFAPEK